MITATQKLKELIKYVQIVKGPLNKRLKSNKNIIQQQRVETNMTATVKTWTEWLKHSRFSYMNEEQKEQTFRWLSSVKDKILERANIKSDDVIIDVGTGTGLLAFGAYELVGQNGKVIASDSYEDCIEECGRIAKNSDIRENFELLLSDAASIKMPDNSVDIVVMRSVLVHILEKQSVLDECYRILKPGGRISIFEPIISSNTRYHELINPENFSNYERIKEIEDKVMSMPNDPLTNFNDKTLEKNFSKAGFKNIDIDLNTEQSAYKASASMVGPWFNTPPSPGSLTLRQRFLQYMSEEGLDNYIKELKAELDNKIIVVKSYSAYISAEK